MTTTTWVFRPHVRPGDASLLSHDERLRAGARRRDAETVIAVRAALRRVLAAATGTDPRSLAFTTGPRGKPGLAGGPEFSVSHTAGLAAIAVAEDPVGVDVERVRPDHVTPALAARLGAHPPDVFAVWTVREACGKATGDGLLAALADPAVPPGHTVRALRTPDGFAGALCTREGSGPVIHIEEQP